MKKKLTKKRQLAVDIAKDVLKHLAARELRVNHDGGYCSGTVKNCKIEENDQVQKHIQTLRKNCDVCAKGALFLSYVELKNKVIFNHVNVQVSAREPNNKDIWFGPSSICEALAGAFTQENMNLIEEAFESTETSLLGSYINSAAEKFGLRYSTPGRRMKAICENIIENDGEFVLE